MQTLLLSKQPITQAQIAVRNPHASRYVDGRVEWKLDPFNDVEDDGVFQTAAMEIVRYV